jgi:hypothetical protein
MTGLLIAAAFALGGCATAAPSDPGASTPKPAPTSDATPAPTAEPTASTVVIAGLEVRALDAAGSVLSTLPYASDPELATELFTDLFEAAPVVTSYPEAHCVPSHTIAAWRDTFSLVYDYSGIPEGQLFQVGTGVATLAGITLETTTGHAVGDSTDLLVAGLSPSQISSTEFEGVACSWADYDVAVGERSADSSEQGAYWGAVAESHDGVISSITAPMHYVDNC